MSDRNATAVLEAAAAGGRDVPRDLSVVGFDNAPESAISSPPLTTVAQPLVEKGRETAEPSRSCSLPRLVKPLGPMGGGFADLPVI